MATRRYTIFEGNSIHIVVSTEGLDSCFREQGAEPINLAQASASPCISFSRTWRKHLPLFLGTLLHHLQAKLAASLVANKST
ncbi:hypothetical protein OK016_12225 [Vibrio chagasii]|nr:hypothetical protein [Vibrio chagasii]